MKKLVIVVTLLCIMIISSNTKTYAAINELTSLEDMGTYTQTETVMKRVKVYINLEMREFIESTGKTVYSTETKHYFIGIYVYSSYDYYFYEDQFVTEIVEQRRLYNDIDTLIYMINELGNLANEYDPNGDHTNYILSYVRGINKDYVDDSYFGGWKYLAGNIDQDFITYVDQNDGVGIEFSEYFAQFLQGSNQLNPVYGYVSTIYKDKHLKLLDPFNQDSFIDVLHMFASMDGIYNQTGNSVTLGNNHQRDLLSWLGDLHQFTRTIHSRGIDVSTLPTYYTGYYSGYTNNSIDFETFTGVLNSGFSEPDLLADIDAMNITKTFLDYSLNSVGDSLSAYYNIIKGDNNYYPNRYKMFISTVTLELEYPLDSTLESKFRSEVYQSMNLKISNGNIINYTYYVANMYLGFGLLRGSYLPLTGDMPSLETRAYTAKLFADYIIEMSSRAYYYTT
jgi:hypothetical protein